jgi:hypothetical protein
MIKLFFGCVAVDVCFNNFTKTLSKSKILAKQDFCGPNRPLLRIEILNSQDLHHLTIVLTNSSTIIF